MPECFQSAPLSLSLSLSCLFVPVSGAVLSWRSGSPLPVRCGEWSVCLVIDLGVFVLLKPANHWVWVHFFLSFVLYLSSSLLLLSDGGVQSCIYLIVSYLETTAVTVLHEFTQRRYGPSQVQQTDWSWLVSCCVEWWSLCYFWLSAGHEYGASPFARPRWDTWDYCVQLTSYLYHYFEG